jgi:2-keto-4-pentenoate hydratase/2-oxohepta-3-ene-1,7-dioic acid hydratase in catechol pathway
VRFVASDGKTYFGDAILPSGSTDSRLATSAYKITGDVFNEYSVSAEVLAIDRLLSPIDPEQVRSVRMIGMNYKKHAEEINMALPKWPCLFYKPVSAISSSIDDIVVPKVAQLDDDRVDYEAELVVVLGKRARDVSEEDALDYVLGYTSGNDVSQRTWQIERGSTQFSLGKMFDTWAPIGPAIVSTEVIRDPNELKIGSKINGEVRQQSSTNDAIFNVRQLIAFLSQGTTLLPGDLIFTGTPQGVGAGFKPTPKWLKDGDLVEIEIENIGTLHNRVRFE